MFNMFTINNSLTSLQVVIRVTMGVKNILALPSLEHCPTSLLQKWLQRSESQNLILHSYVLLSFGKRNLAVKTIQTITNWLWIYTYTYARNKKAQLFRILDRFYRKCSLHEKKKNKILDIIITELICLILIIIALCLIQN